MILQSSKNNIAAWTALCASGAAAMLIANNFMMQVVVVAILFVLFYITLTITARPYAYALLLFSLPLSFELKTKEGFSLFFPSEIFLLITVLGFFFFAVQQWQEIKAYLKQPLVWLLLADLVWMYISAVKADESLVAFKRTGLKTLYFLGYFMILQQWIANEKKPHLLFSLYAIGMIIPVIFTIYMHSKGNFTPDSAPKVSRPFYNDHTIYGAMIAFVIPFLCIPFRNKYLSVTAIVFLLFMLVAEFFSFSRASWISLFVAGGVFLLLRFKIKFSFLLGLVAIAGGILFWQSESIIQSIAGNEATSSEESISEHAISVTNVETDASNLERINRWNCAIRMFKERPLFGFGPGTYQFEYHRFQQRTEMTYISTFNGEKGNSHSEYLSALSETGAPGFVLFVAIVLYTTWLGFHLYRRYPPGYDRKVILAAFLGLITYDIHGLFNHFSDTDKAAVLLYGSMAILSYYKMKLSEEPEEEKGEVRFRETTS